MFNVHGFIFYRRLHAHPRQACKHSMVYGVAGKVIGCRRRRCVDTVIDRNVRGIYHLMIRCGGAKGLRTSLGGKASLIGGDSRFRVRPLDGDKVSLRRGSHDDIRSELNVLLRLAQDGVNHAGGISGW